MNNEKPVTEEQIPAPAQEQKPQREKKPVIIYIMILFIAAFLLMALSFAMHQRSNQEALGQLETSFNATIQDMQANQELLMELQDQLADAESQLADLQEAQAETDAALAAAQSELSAMEQLYWLQQNYSNGKYEACKAIIDQMEANGSVNNLASVPYNTDNGVITAPFLRFQQLKEATLIKLAEAAE